MKTIPSKPITAKSVIEQGIKQLSGYMEKLGEKIGWLIIFDRNSEKSWEEKVYWKTVEKQELKIHILGC